MGISNRPIMPSAHPLDSLITTDEANGYAYTVSPWGCCINNEFIHEWQDDTYINPNYIVTTLAHELGHYLGLLHTFSTDECNIDDACDDTPVCDYNSYAAYIVAYIRQKLDEGIRSFSMAELARRTDCATGEEYTAHNLMDYAYCYNDQFTPQQLNRTRQVLWYSPLVPGPKLTEDGQRKADHIRNAWPRSWPSSCRPGTSPRWTTRRRRGLQS
mgnify:CR=1 FL=1